MTIVVFGNQKGGCSKSTTALGLAAAAIHRGLKVCITDADINESCNNHIRRRNLHNEELVEAGKEQYPFIKCEVKRPDDALDNDLLELEKYYDLVIVDTGGFANRAFKTAIKVADMVYLPYQPCLMDMDQLAPSMSVIKQTEEFIADIQPGYSIDSRLLIALVDQHSKDLMLEAKKLTKPFLPWCSMSNVVISTVKKVKLIQDKGLMLSDIKHPKRAMYELLLAEVLGERPVAYQRGQEIG